MKNSLKKIIGLIFGNNLSFNLLRFLNRRKLLVLYYHRIAQKEEFVNNLSKHMYVDLDFFDKQIKFLKKFYNFVSEKNITEALENGLSLPNYSIWITFDDGYKDNYINAYPILKKYNIPATFFVTTGYINQTSMPSGECNEPYFMSWEELKEVSGNNIPTGAHTASHRILSGLSDAELEKEIIESKNEIEQRLGRKVISFAYPRGKKSDYIPEKCVPILKKANFKLAVSTIGGFNRIRRNNNCFNFRRIGLSYNDSLNFFRFKLATGSFWQ